MTPIARTGHAGAIEVNFFEVPTLSGAKTGVQVARESEPIRDPIRLAHRPVRHSSEDTIA